MQPFPSAPLPTPNPPSDFTWKTDDNAVTITRFLNQTATVCVVPDEIDGAPVTQIGDSAFEQRRLLTSVALPNGARRVGVRAFAHCRSLASIQFGDGLQHIDKKAFLHCRSLTSVEFSDALRQIDAKAFAGCESLAFVVLGAPSPKIDVGAFFPYPTLRFIVSPDGNATIPGLCCQRLTLQDFTTRQEGGALFSADGKTLQAVWNVAEEYVVPDAVERVDERAFDARASLTSLVFPDRLQTLPRNALRRLAALKTVFFGAQWQTLDAGLFRNCRQLTAIEVAPNNERFRSVDGVLFSADGKTLTRCPPGKSGDYVVPEGVATIGKYAFYGCRSLTSIALPKTLRKIDDCAFFECEALTSIALPNALQSLGEHAFFGCRSLPSIALPDSLPTFDVGAFYGCVSLKSIDVASTSPYFSAVDGVLFSKNGAILVLFPPGRSGNYVVPNSVRLVGERAFYVADQLTSIMFGNRLQTIANSALARHNSNLTLYGAEGSVAEEYARQRCLRFKPR